MFENALISRAESNQHLDIGLIVETMFFYRSTQLLLNSGVISELARKLSADDLIALFDRSRVKLTYIRPNFAVVTAGPLRESQFIAAHFGGRPEQRVRNYKEEISMMLERSLGSSRETKKLIKFINDRVALRKFNDADKERIVPRLAQQDMEDKTFVTNGAAIILKHLVPELQLPPDFRFAAIDSGQGYIVDTNLNFKETNNLYHRRVSPAHSTITSPYILAHFITARADSYFAANYMSEIVTSPISNALIRIKHFDFLSRRHSNAEEINLFRETVLKDFPTMGEVINRGERTISDFLRLPGSNWLVGLEGEAGYLHLSGARQDVNATANGLSAADSIDGSRLGDTYGVIAGRLGYASTNWLFYGKGGVAFVPRSYSFTDFCIGPGAPGCGGGYLVNGRSGTDVTYAAGGGIEYAFDNNWSIKAEYLYLGTQKSFSGSATSVVAPAGTVFSNTNSDPGIHTGKIGLNYKFGGPVVARY